MCGLWLPTHFVQHVLEYEHEGLHHMHSSQLQSPPMSHYTKDVWVLLGTVARSTRFSRRLREGGAPGEENKNLLEGRQARASYLIRGSTLSSPLYNFESHSSGDQEKCNEFIFKFFFFFFLLLCSYLENCETLDYVGNVIQGGSQCKPVFQRDSRLPDFQGQVGKTWHSGQDDLCQLWPCRDDFMTLRI